MREKCFPKSLPGNLGPVQEVLHSRREVPSSGPLEKLVAGLGLPIRRPTLCSGCPHRSSFFAIKKRFPMVFSRVTSGVTPWE